MPLTTLRVQLNEDSYDQLEARAAARSQTAETAGSFLLRDALKQLPVDGRCVVVYGAALERLEAIFQGGSVLTPQDLVQKVERQAGITYGNIRLEFTPGQLEEIARRAERLSLTPEELIRRTVKKMEELFFTHMGVGAGV